MNRVLMNYFGRIAGPLLCCILACSPKPYNPLNNLSKTGISNELKTTTDSLVLAELLHRYPGMFDSVLLKKDELNIQVIYTSIKRHGKEISVLADHYYNVDTARYFYPASAVKLPVVLLALQRLNELNTRGLNKYTTMLTGEDGDRQTAVRYDSSSADGNPSIAQYIKKILLVSDNDAFNRLYEFLGQEYINSRLHNMGYKDAEIIHRLSITLTEQQNRHTNPIRFVDKAGKVVYEQPAQKSNWVYAGQNTKLGNGYMKGDELINEPFDFSQRNRLSLPDLHFILRSVIFPLSVPAEKRFNLSADDYSFLHKYLSLYPRQSGFPHYDSTAYPDNYVKTFLNDKHDNNIHVYSKSGTAYGFLTDIAYITDPRHKIEFFLSATIYCNSDGIFNDDMYDYERVGYPFFKNLARVVQSASQQSTVSSQ